MNTEIPEESRLRRADELQEKGSLQEAQGIYESVVTALSAKKPSPQLGHALNGLSNVTSSLGDHQQAVELAQRAGEVYRKLGDADGQAYALNNQGIAEGELGLYSAAQASLLAALTFSQRANNAETQTRTLSNLGNTYYLPGEYLEALRAYQDAWKLAEAHASEKWSGYWRQISKINQATLFQRLGRYQDALQIYKQVETSSKQLSASDHAQVLVNLGVLCRRLGDSWKALDNYQKALALYSRQHEASAEINVLKNIGMVYALDRGDFDTAQQFFENSLHRAQENGNQLGSTQAHLNLGETLLRRGDLKSGLTEFQNALAQAQPLGANEEQWKALYGIGRIEELSGQPALAEADYRKAIATVEKGRAQLQLSALRSEYLADKRDVYDSLITFLARGDTKEAFAVLERSRARNFQDRFSRDQAGANSSKETGSEETSSPAALDLDEAQRYLNPATILLEFWASGDRVALLWCTRQASGIEQLQVTTSERDNLLNLLRKSPESLQGDWRNQFALLSRLMPAALSSPNLRHVVIVPDAWLSSVPFDLVPLSLSSNTLLIERFDISYLPTASVLRRAVAPSNGIRFPWQQQVVAFGNPTIPQQSTTATRFENAATLPALPYSATEIAAIAKLAPGRSALHLGAGERHLQLQRASRRHSLGLNPHLKRKLGKNANRQRQQRECRDDNRYVASIKCLSSDHDNLLGRVANSIF